MCGLMGDLHAVLEQTLLSEDKVKGGAFGVGTRERLEVKSL